MLGHYLSAFIWLFFRFHFLQVLTNICWKCGSFAEVGSSVCDHELFSAVDHSAYVLCAITFSHFLVNIVFGFFLTIFLTSAINNTYSVTCVKLVSGLGFDYVSFVIWLGLNGTTKSSWNNWKNLVSTIRKVATQHVGLFYFFLIKAFLAIYIFTCRKYSLSSSATKQSPYFDAERICISIICAWSCIWLVRRYICIRF